MLYNYFMFRANNKEKKCPKCGETQDIDQQNGIWHCYRCGYEW
jgi:ribosomal protein L37AE/L43A